MTGGGRYKDGYRGLKVELDRKHRKNASVNFPDFEEDHDHSLWLSSECKSPPMLSLFDDSQDPLWNLEAPLASDASGPRDCSSSSGVCSESGDSCFTPGSLCASSFTTLSTQGGGEDIWVSSLDLDVEDSELVARCGEQGFDVFGSDFPSPCVGSRQPVQSTPDCDSSDAIFWPFDRKSYVLRDFEKNFLCLSPRKDVRNVGAEVLERSTSMSRSTCNVQTRRITISPPTLSTAAAGGSRTRDQPKKKSNQDTRAAPPRRSRLHRASSGRHGRAVSGKEGLLLQHDDAKAVLDLETDVDFRSLVAQGAAIEALVGLSEFDGREGIGVGCCDDDSELVLD